MEITYTAVGDYLLPNIVLSDPPNAPPLGYYGMRHKAYLREHKPILYGHVLKLYHRLYYCQKRQMLSMVTIPVRCPNCGTEDVSSHGKSQTNVPRYKCNNPDCPKHTFMLTYTNKGYEPGINEKIIKMAANGSGIRDTARVLGVSIQKVVDTLKKQRQQY